MKRRDVERTVFRFSNSHCFLRRRRTKSRAPSTRNGRSVVGIRKMESGESGRSCPALRGGLIGSPETIRSKLRKFQTSNVDQIIFLNQAGKNSHEHICESLELFAEQVMPEFHANEPAHQDWKRRVLSGDLELEEIDTTPHRDRYGKNSVRVTKPFVAPAA